MTRLIRRTKRVNPHNLNYRIKDINWRAAVAALLVTGLAWLTWVYLQSRTNQASLQRNLQSKQLELDTKLKELEKTKGTSVELQKQLDATKAQKTEVEKQLQAKKDSAKVYAAVLPVAYVAPVSAVIAGCGDNSYAQYIYQHESGCNLASMNSIGCRGIGQACPGSKLPCGADYACQNAFFTNYAITRYGSWESAYNFWVQHSWW